MQITELPPEILHVILYHAALGRGIKRAVRLRLVCKPWAAALHDALFETHMMDGMRYPGLGSWAWHLKNQHGAVKLWHKYLVYRVLNEEELAVGRFVEMRHIAQTLCKETHQELRAVLEALCWLTIETRAEGAEHFCHGGPLYDRRRGVPLSLGDSLLAVATHLNILSLVQRLLADGHSPENHDRLFARPLQIAGQTGNIALLQLFQEQLPKGTIESWSMIGAAIKNDLEVMQVVVRLFLGTDPKNDWSLNQLGSIKYDTQVGKGIITARKYTSSPEVYDYLTSLIEPQVIDFASYNQLREHARLGNISIVRHLLEAGVPVQDSEGQRESPLVMACMGRHVDVVKLLLEYGAETEFLARQFYPIYPLHLGATADDPSLARILIEHGARLDLPRKAGDTYPALWWAFAREHPSMIRFLIEQGASFNSPCGEAWIAESVAEMTHQLSYGSMADMLRLDYGFTFPEPSVPYPEDKKDSRWNNWPEAVSKRRRWIENRRAQLRASRLQVQS